MTDSLPFVPYHDDDAYVANLFSILASTQTPLYGTHSGPWSSEYISYGYLPIQSINRWCRGFPLLDHCAMQKCTILFKYTLSVVINLKNEFSNNAFRFRSWIRRSVDQLCNTNCSFISSFL